MADILNAGDIQLQATVPRLVRTELPDNLVVPAVKELKLNASSSGFRVTNTGTSNLTEITFLATLIHIDESSTVYMSVTEGGTLQAYTIEGIPADRTKKLLFTDMTSTSVRVTATVIEYPNTDNERTFTAFVDVVKLQDGYDAEYLVLSGEQVFKYMAASVTPVNTTVTLTATLYGHLTNYQWQYFNRTTNAWINFTNGTSSTYTLAHDFGGWGTNNNLKVQCVSTYSGVDYSDEMTIVKIYDGMEGLTPVMPNSSHTVPSNQDGVVESYVGSGTQIQIYDGATALQYTSNTTLQAGQFRIVSTTVTPGANDITVSTTRNVLTVNSVNVGVTIGNHSAMSNTQDVVKITYNIRARRYGDDSGLIENQVTFNLDQTITKSKAGVSAKMLRISSEGLVFTKKRDFSITPNRLKLTAKKQSLTVSPTWTTSPAITLRSVGGAALTGASLTTDEVYVYQADLGSNTAIDITATAVQPNSLNQSPETLTDTEKMIVVTEGTDGLASSMTNGSHTMPSNDLGVVDAADYAGSGTGIRVFEGATELDYVSSIASADRSKFTLGTAIVTPAASISVGTYSDNNADGGMLVGNHSGMSASASLVTIEYPITVRRANGTDTTLKLTQTITKSTAGVDAKSLKLLASAVTFKYNTNGVLEPSGQSITFTAAIQNVESTVPTFVCKTYTAANVVINSNVTLTAGASDFEKVLSAINFGAAEYATIECALTYRSVVYNDKITVFRVKDGAKGEPGVTPPRTPFNSYGKNHTSNGTPIYLDGIPSSWLDGSNAETANGYKASNTIWKALGNTTDVTLGSISHLVVGDTVTLTSPVVTGGAPELYATTRVWKLNSSGVLGWCFPGKVISGDLLVQGTVTADAIQAGTFSGDNVLTQNLTVRDGAGNIILSSGNPLKGIYIALATITEGNIGNLEVSSIKIKGENISITREAQYVPQGQRQYRTGFFFENIVTDTGKRIFGNTLGNSSVNMQPWYSSSVVFNINTQVGIQSMFLELKNTVSSFFAFDETAGYVSLEIQLKAVAGTDWVTASTEYNGVSQPVNQAQGPGSSTDYKSTNTNTYIYIPTWNGPTELRVKVTPYGGNDITVDDIKLKIITFIR